VRDLGLGSVAANWDSAVWLMEVGFVMVVLSSSHRNPGDVVITSVALS
jgi:pyruvate dehydrogenase complex dehydrogenase (E1) component